jgi:hypothetical protein
VNQIVEDMLRACALQYGRSWDKSLSYAKFSYNNSYQESLKMAPFEILYGHRCQTLLFWNNTGEHKVFGPDILQEAEKQVHMVRENLVIHRSEIVGTKPPYVCPGCFIHIYSNNMITRFHVQ